MDIETPRPDKPLISSEKAKEVGDALEKHRAQLKKQSEKTKETKDKDLLMEGQRINEFNWPKGWDRHSKREYKKACKRARKKGFKPDTWAWNDELRRAGFKFTKKDEEKK